MAWQIEIEKTPNPSTMKFKFNHKVADRTASYKLVGDTDNSPLAAKIFGFPWTQSVFIGEDFVSITKADWVDWDMLCEPLAGLIKEHVEIGVPVLLAEKALIESQDDLEGDQNTALIRNIKKFLDNEIRPAVARDGGDVVFRKFDSGRLYISMLGACSGCPSSKITLKDGIERRIRELFEEIQEVISI